MTTKIKYVPKIISKILGIRSPIYFLWLFINRYAIGLTHGYIWFRFTVVFAVAILWILSGYSISFTDSGSDQDGIYISKKISFYSYIDDKSTLKDGDFVIGCNQHPEDPKFCKVDVEHNKSIVTQFKRGQYIDFCLPSQISTQVAFGAGLPRGDCFYGGDQLRKHIAGIPGDIILETENGVFINGTLLSNSQPISKRSTITIPLNQKIVIPENYYYVAGKNPHSFDSRYYGLVHLGFIKSKSYLLVGF